MTRMNSAGDAAAESSDPTGAPAMSRRELRERTQAAAKTPTTSIGAITSKLGVGRSASNSRAREIAVASSPAAARRSLANNRVVATKPSKGPLGRRIMKSMMSVGAMAGVTAMLISTSISANAFGPVEFADAATMAESVQVEAETQSLGVLAPPAASVPELERDTYVAEAYVPPKPKFTSYSGGLAGNPNFSYTNNPGGSIQWPFPNTVPISYGFGPRSACSYCSTYHLGVDFTPGSGVAIQAITAGTVSAIDLDSGGLGNHVTIDHVVNGQRIQSVYAHMAWGSIRVAVGQQVAVGTIIGAVGSTGASTGAHLHLEIHADGTPIDPFAWLKANAN